MLPVRRSGYMINRRTFLAAAAAGTRVQGAPVRDTPLRANFFGPLYYDQKETPELIDVVETGRPFRWYGPGNEPPRKVLTFEKEFAAADADEVCAGGNFRHRGAADRHRRARIGPGDEVILPAWTWHSCFNAIVLAGALPVFAEIDESFNHRPGRYRAHITPQTKLIIAVHLQGNPGGPRPHPADRAQARPEGAGGLRAERGRQLQGQAGGLDGRYRHLQPAAQQDHHGGRRRRGRHQRSAAVRARSALPRPGRPAPPHEKMLGERSSTGSSAASSG